MSQIKALQLYCRAGFEAECAAEIQEVAAALGVAGYAQTHTGSAIVKFHVIDMPPDLALLHAVRFRNLVFARQLLVLLGVLDDLPPDDRVTPIIRHLGGTRVSQLLLETPDTNTGKQLQGLCKKFTRPMTAALQQAGLYLENDASLPRLHLVFLESTRVALGLSAADNASPWLMGIPRLKFPREAPSRSTLKLDEAILHFLTPQQQQTRLAPAMTAVDLGAAPGGWSYQLVRRHIRVIAVDNGAMANSLLDSGLVQHLRSDAFSYRPPKPVDWLVCDMVEQPARVAALVAAWVARGDCRDCIFNLKLPMKKRYQEVKRCEDVIRQRLDAAGIAYSLSFKQLYHDREEVTGYLHTA